MMEVSSAAYIFCALSLVVVLFQLALALGAPWGEMAMGGRFPGRFPPKLRVAAIVQMLLLVFIALVVLSRAGIAFATYHDHARWGIWFVVALCTVSAILNSITPSKKERLLWAPVTLVLLVCSVVVAIS